MISCCSDPSLCQLWPVEGSLHHSGTMLLWDAVGKPHRQLMPPAWSHSAALHSQHVDHTLDVCCRWSLQPQATYKNGMSFYGEKYKVSGTFCGALRVREGPFAA